MKTWVSLKNHPNKLNIEFVEHMGYYIPKSAMEGFDPNTYFDGPILDENGLCDDEECQKLRYCKQNCPKIMRE